VAVLFFQLNITGATLEPGDVSLLSSTNPVPVNVSQLQTESAFLGNKNVPAGTYTSLSLTFGPNSQLTIFNASDTAISSTCAVGKVCQLTPAPTPLTLTFGSTNSTALPVTLSASAPLGFMLDIHLNTVIQSDLSVNLGIANGVTLSQVSPPSSGPPNPPLGKLEGTIQSVGSNQFTLQAPDGRTATILVNSSTTYIGFPSSACSTETFSCLAAGQTVKVTVSLQSGGTLLATEVDYVQPAALEAVQGDIVGLSTSGGNTIMDLIVQEQVSSSTSEVLPPLGQHVSVTVPPGSAVTYAVDWGSFTYSPPSGSAALSFASATDLQVGQDVRVGVVPGSVTTSTGTGAGSTTGPTPVGPASVSFTASSIKLEPSQITGTVSATNPGGLSFTLATLPAFFVPPSATAGAAPNLAPFAITVQTTTATIFKPSGSSFSGLQLGNVVSVHGWVFSTPGGANKITVAADGVLLRSAVTPLF
jgi:hypothetical protein